jgi:hypothetical protein
LHFCKPTFEEVRGLHRTSWSVTTQQAIYSVQQQILVDLF